MSKKLITEMFTDLVTEEKGSDLYLYGIFSSAELENGNGRVYGKPLLEREVTKINKKIKKSLWGELGHPPNPDINPDKIAIKIESLDWEGNNVIGKAKVLDTPMGGIAKTLIKEGNIGISSRGLGTVGSDGRVNNDFNLLTWDLVTEPSNNPSWVKGIYEGKTWEEANSQPELSLEEAQELFTKHQMEFIKKIINKI